MEPKTAKRSFISLSQNTVGCHINKDAKTSNTCMLFFASTKQRYFSTNSSENEMICYSFLFLNGELNAQMLTLLWQGAKTTQW